MRRHVSSRILPRGGSFAEGLPKISEDRATRAFASAMDRVEPLLVDVEARLNDGGPFDGVLGVTCDEIHTSGLGTFDDMTEGADAGAARALFEQALDARLELLFVKHLSALRAKALAAFKAGDQSPEDVDRSFKAAAEAAKRTGAAWSYDADRASLKAVVLEMKQRQDRVTSVTAKAASQQQSYMQLFQTYQAQIQQLQQAVSAAPAAASIAYRVPDTDFALSAKKEQDKTTLSVGCVPDDSAPLLGVNGFVKGVTPFNVGLTLNLHV